MAASLREEGTRAVPAQAYRGSLAAGDQVRLEEGREGRRGEEMGGRWEEASEAFRRDRVGKRACRDHQEGL